MKKKGQQECIDIGMLNIEANIKIERIKKWLKIIKI